MFEIYLCSFNFNRNYIKKTVYSILKGIFIQNLNLKFQFVIAFPIVGMHSKSCSRMLEWGGLLKSR